MKVVTVQFTEEHVKNGRNYSYYTDLSVKVGDLVVVPAVDKVKVATVTKTVNITEDEKGFAAALIIQKVNIKNYEKRVDKYTRAAALYGRLDQLLADNVRMAEYKALAKNNREAKKLLKKLESLSKEG